MSVSEFPHFNVRQRKRLLEIAREAILEKLTRGVVPEGREKDEGLLIKTGVFVSLLDGDQALLGSMGTLYAERAIHQGVAEMAAEAATSDPRFQAMHPRELKKTDIEISILTPFQPIAVEDIEVGRHGLYVAQGSRRGVLLPQVATQFGWSRAEFLAQACKKARLAEDAWKDPATQVMAFTAQVFSDLGEMAD